MSDYFKYNKTSNLLNQPNRNQSVTIYDLLSEGPIQGLLQDGIFLEKLQALIKMFMVQNLKVQLMLFQQMPLEFLKKMFLENL